MTRTMLCVGDILWRNKLCSSTISSSTFLPGISSLIVHLLHSNSNSHMWDFFSTWSSSPTSSGCPTIQLNSDTLNPEIAWSHKRVQSSKAAYPTTSDVNCKPWLLSMLLISQQTGVSKSQVPVVICSSNWLAIVQSSHSPVLGVD